MSRRRNHEGNFSPLLLTIEKDPVAQKLCLKHWNTTAETKTTATTIFSISINSLCSEGINENLDWKCSVWNLEL
jgi:hypothetical protein